MLDAHRRGQRERLHRHRLKPVLACGACQARLLVALTADHRALNQRMANLLDLLGDCARLYHRAPNCLKKLLNRIFFDAILVNTPHPDTASADAPAVDGRHPGQPTRPRHHKHRQRTQRRRHTRRRRQTPRRRRHRQQN